VDHFFLSFSPHCRNFFFTAVLFFLPGATPCPVCGEGLYQGSQSFTLLFLCRHVVHAHCASGGEDVPQQIDTSFVVGLSGLDDGRSIGAKIALWVIRYVYCAVYCVLCTEMCSFQRCDGAGADRPRVSGVPSRAAGRKRGDADDYVPATVAPLSPQGCTPMTSLSSTATLRSCSQIVALGFVSFLYLAGVQKSRVHVYSMYALFVALLFRSFGVILDGPTLGSIVIHGVGSSSRSL
jgi:hypothetical protein